MAEVSVTLNIPAIHCAGCVATVGKALEPFGGTVVTSALEAKRVTVQFDDERVRASDLKDALEDVGFPPAEAE